MQTALTFFRLVIESRIHCGIHIEQWDLLSFSNVNSPLAEQHTYNIHISIPTKYAMLCDFLLLLLQPKSLIGIQANFHHPFSLVILLQTNEERTKKKSRKIRRNTSHKERICDFSSSHSFITFSFTKKTIVLC